MKAGLLKCYGNDDMRSIPPGMLNDHDMILWCLKLQFDYSVKVSTWQNKLQDSKYQLIESEKRQQDVQNSLQILEKEVDVFERTRPSKYINFKSNLVDKYSKVKSTFRWKQRNLKS